MADNPTTKLKIDISELKKNIQEANRLIKLANSEFKASSAGMDDWAKSADGISSKLAQLNKVVDAQEEILGSLEKQYALVSAAQGENSKGAQELAIKINNQKAAIAKTQSEIKKWQEALRDTANSGDDLRKSISDQEDELASLKKKYADLVLTQGKSSQEAKDTANAIEQLSSELRDNKKSISDADKAADDLDKTLDDLDDSAKSAGDGFTVLKGALANLVADGINAAISGLKDLATSSDQAYNSFQAQTGTSTEEMSRFKKEMDELYKGNYGESMEDIAESMAKVAQNSKETDPSKIKELTQNAIVLRDTFGFEVPETMRAVNMMMDQFGITGDEAFNLIAQGAQNGLDKNGDLLDSINEYSVHYKQVGLGAEEMFNSFQNGTAAGTFSVDKLGDAMKEFGIRVKDGSDSTHEALDMIGLDWEAVENGFSQGGDKAKEYMSDVVKYLFELEDPMERNAAGVALFGTMWEDLGEEGIKALADVSGEADKSKKTLEEINAVKYQDIGNQLAEVGRTAKVELLQPIVESVLPAIRDELIPAFKEGLGWIINNKDLLISAIAGVAAGFAAWNVVTTIQGVIKAVKAFTKATEGATLAQKLFNLAQKANVIGIVITAITALVTAFVVLWNTSDEFRAFWINLWEIIKNAASVAWEAIKGFFSGAWDTIKGIWNGAGKFFSGIWDGIKDAFADVGKWFGKKFKDGAKQRDEAWSNTKKWASDTWGNIKNTFADVGDWFGKKFKEGVEKRNDAWSSTQKWASDTWGKIKDVFSNVGSWFGEKFGNAWQAIKDKFAGWGEFWSGLWTKIKNKFSDIGSNVGSAISDTIKEGLNGVLSTVERTINKGIRMINKAIRLANEIPGIDVGEVSELSLPRLEKGGILKKGQVGLLEGNGTEAVVPLEKNKLWIRNTAKAMSVELKRQSAHTTQQLTQPQPINQIFNQYNTSPKALSRLEIYRQTKNQFRFAKGV